MQLPLMLNRSIIVDQVAQFLIATKQVPYNSEIVDIDFVEFNKTTGKANITVHFKKEELEVTYFDTDVTPQSSQRN